MLYRIIIGMVTTVLPDDLLLLILGLICLTMSCVWYVMPGWFHPSVVACFGHWLISGWWLWRLGPCSSYAEILCLLVELLVQNTIQVKVQNAIEIKQHIDGSIIVFKPIIWNGWHQLLSNCYGGNEHAVIMCRGCTMLRVQVTWSRGGNMLSTYGISEPDWQNQQHVGGM